jgi:hypothetical protein
LQENTAADLSAGFPAASAAPNMLGFGILNRGESKAKIGRSIARQEVWLPWPLAGCSVRTEFTIPSVRQIGGRADYPNETVGEMLEAATDTDRGDRFVLRPRSLFVPVHVPMGASRQRGALAAESAPPSRRLAVRAMTVARFRRRPLAFGFRSSRRLGHRLLVPTRNLKGTDSSGKGANSSRHQYRRQH